MARLSVWSDKLLTMTADDQENPTEHPAASHDLGDGDDEGTPDEEDESGDDHAPHDSHDHAHSHMVHQHRDVQGGEARAAVFGFSDGLVSNVALIIGISTASSDGSLVRLAGISGLLAGAISMAAGEWVSIRAHNELVEREIAIERKSLAENPKAEIRELAAIYRERGLKPETAAELASEIMADPEVALDVHAREELGVDPAGAGTSPAGGAVVVCCLRNRGFRPSVPLADCRRPWRGGRLCGCGGYCRRDGGGSSSSLHRAF